MPIDGLNYFKKALKRQCFLLIFTNFLFLYITTQMESAQSASHRLFPQLSTLEHVFFAICV